MKVRIVSDEGKVLFEISPSERFSYHANDGELYKAILSEVLWTLHKPFAHFPEQNCQINQKRQY